MAERDMPPGNATARSELETGTEVLQAATRVLAGIALQSLDALDGAVSLAQFRMLAVLADLGPTRSGRVARALGIEASTVTRLADRLVGAGHVVRGSDPDHRGVVTLELTESGQHLVAEVANRRRGELERILAALPAADRRQAITGVRLLVDVASEGHGVTTRNPVPL